MLLFLVCIVLHSICATEEFLLPEIIYGDILGQSEKASVSQVSIPQTWKLRVKGPDIT